MPKGSGKSIVKVNVNMDVSRAQTEELMETLAFRFEKNMQRHEGRDWEKIATKLAAQPKKISSLYAMESTGGEPDVVGYDKKADEYLFCDCAEQSPERRSICYDDAGLRERIKKGIFPAGNAVALADAMGIELLNEEQYRELQRRGEFDTKTSSWIKTPTRIRDLGGALFADRRYDTVFVYHNGAQSFYSARGFRGALKV